jgi:hypothetical protein
MTVLGLTRLRRHLLARQPVMGTEVPALRAYPFSGVPIPDLGWTDAEADFGSRIIVAAPTREAPSFTASLTDPALNYNDLPLQLSAFLGGQVAPTGGGTAQTWAWDPDYTQAGDPDVYTYERGSDPDGTGGKPNDWFQWYDGLLTGLTIDSPQEGAGVLSTSMDWIFGGVEYAGNSEGPVLTIPSITDVPDTDATPIYLKDASVYLNTDPSDIGGDQLTDAVHNFTLRMTQEVDQKRYANGTQSFALSGYGMGAVTIEVDMVYAKTAETVGSGSESDAWFSDIAVPRYLQIAFESTREAETGVPYSWVFSMPMRYYTRSDGEIGGNEIVTLMGRAFLEPTVLASAFSTEVVCTLTEAELGEAS